MKNIPAIITDVQNFKDNHLLISIFSIQYGKKKLVVFGGKSKKKNSNYVKGMLNEIEFNDDNNCLNSNSVQTFNWFLYDKYRLKTIDYSCYLISKLLFLQDESSRVIEYYSSLISRMNKNQNYLSELMLLELEILKTSGYQPDFNESVLSKIFRNHKIMNFKNNEQIIKNLDNNLELQFLFFDFLGRVISRVLINLHIHLPFPRNDTVKRN